MRLSDAEFSDYVVCFLYDKLSNPKLVIPPEVNPGFNAFTEILQRRGVKSQLFYRYMKMNPAVRSKYRQTRGVYIQKMSNTTASLSIFKTKVDRKNRKTAMDVVKNVVKKISTLGLTIGVVKKIINVVKNK